MELHALQGRGSDDQPRGAGHPPDGDLADESLRLVELEGWALRGAGAHRRGRAEASGAQSVGLGTRATRGSSVGVVALSIITSCFLAARSTNGERS